MRDMYAAMFTYHTLLPDAVGKQNPWALFKMLDTIEGAGSDVDSNEYLDMFYGK